MTLDEALETIKREIKTDKAHVYAISTNNHEHIVGRVLKVNTKSIAVVPAWNDSGETEKELARTISHNRLTAIGDLRLDRVLWEAE